MRWRGGPAAGVGTGDRRFTVDMAMLMFFPLGLAPEGNGSCLEALTMHPVSASSIFHVVLVALTSSAALLLALMIP